MEIPQELRSPVNKALHRLSMGDMTAGEMLSYLSDPRRKNTAFSRQIADRTVNFLLQEGFLDDLRYLKNILRRLDQALVGPRKIRAELTKKCFSARYIEAALEREIDYTDRARRLVSLRKDARELIGTPSGKKKLMDFLVRRGYDYGTASAALGMFSDEI